MGKKTEQLKTKTNEFCHDTFVRFSFELGLKPAEALRELAIIACIIFKHSRYSELRRKISQSKLNQQGVVDEAIDHYLQKKESNVIRIDRREGV